MGNLTLGEPGSPPALQDPLVHIGLDCLLRPTYKVYLIRHVPFPEGLGDGAIRPIAMLLEG